MAVDIKIKGGEVLYFFWPVVTFHSDDLGCDYVKGMRYQVRDGNPKLDVLVKQWIENGFVTLKVPEIKEQVPIIPESKPKRTFFDKLFGRNK